MVWDHGLKQQGAIALQRVLIIIECVRPELRFVPVSLFFMGDFAHQNLFTVFDVFCKKSCNIVPKIVKFLRQSPGKINQVHIVTRVIFGCLFIALQKGNIHCAQQISLIIFVALEHLLKPNCLQILYPLTAMLLHYMKADEAFSSMIRFLSNSSNFLIQSDVALHASFHTLLALLKKHRVSQREI